MTHLVNNEKEKIISGISVSLSSASLPANYPEVEDKLLGFLFISRLCVGAPGAPCVKYVTWSARTDKGKAKQSKREAVGVRFGETPAVQIDVTCPDNCSPP